MTKLEQYLAEAERFRELEVDWTDCGATKRECDALCQRELGYGRAAAAQRLRVADLLKKFDIQPSDVGDVDPSKLRLLSQKRGLPSSRVELLKLMHRLCTATMTRAAEQVREHDDVRPRSILTAAVKRGDGVIAVALATERKKGQLLAIPSVRWATDDELLAYLIGAAVQHGILDVLDESPSQGVIGGLKTRLGALRRRLRVNPQVEAASVTPGERWQRCDELELDDLTRRAVAHLNDALAWQPPDPPPSALRDRDVA